MPVSGGAGSGYWRCPFTHSVPGGGGKQAGVPAGTWRWTQRWSSLQRPRPLACGIVERTQSPPLASPPFQPQLPSTGMMGRRAMAICRSRPSRWHLCQTLHKGGTAPLFSARPSTRFYLPTHLKISRPPWACKQPGQSGRVPGVRGGTR